MRNDYTRGNVRFFLFFYIFIKIEKGRLYKRNINIKDCFWFEWEKLRRTRVQTSTYTQGIIAQITIFNEFATY